MLEDNQLELNVQTMQPNEAYLLYTDVTESWDSECIEWRDEQDNYGDFYVREHRFPCRGGAQEKILTGVIVDDRTLDIVKGRMDDYARKWEEKVRAIHANSTDRPNFEIVVVYSLELIRKVVI